MAKQMTDKDYAAAIRVALEHVGQAITAARKAGLEVEIVGRFDYLYGAERTTLPNVQIQRRL